MSGYQVTWRACVDGQHRVLLRFADGQTFSGYSDVSEEAAIDAVVKRVEHFGGPKEYADWLGIS